MPYVQTGRPLSISTPLGENTLLLRSLTGVEGISQLFSFDVELLSEAETVDFRAIIGQKVTLALIHEDGRERYWNGYIQRFSQGPRDAYFASYHATIVPWLWLLSRTADCRIFQKKKTPDIVRQIFEDLGFQDFELRLYGDFAEREYCVQYRETDLNFVSRLMEEEGIHYFFEHTQGKHTLILANDAAAHQPCVIKSTIAYHPVKGGVRPNDVIFELRQEQEFHPESYSLADYNFEAPSAPLGVSVPARKTYDVYDYPGEYRKRTEGDALAKIRLQEQTARGMVIRGVSDCHQFESGRTFDLIHHYRDDLNMGYTITAIHHSASQGGYESDGSDSEFTYRNTFECIPQSTVFRPPRITPQPFVQGCQTAVVVGPSGEEIYTDKHGRVKVQFHWDREGKKNENSSCWIRVSHPWAGQGWGALSIPRIGQEVVVDFLEGDPDQPLIIGRVYNAEQMPPFGMPGGAVVSGIKSNSTKGGGGYNEISLNDTKGTELINIHAQFDQQKKVEHDERVTIGNNRTESVGVNESITIGSNRTEKVGVNETISIGSNRTETVGSNESITVALTRTRNVGINEMINIGAAQEITIGGLQALTVGAARVKSIGGSETVNIGASQTISIGAAQTVSVGAAQSITVGANRSLNVGGNLAEEIGGNHSEAVGKDLQTSAAGKIVLDAGAEILLKCGSASLLMKKDGTIALQGKDISIKGSGKISVQADGNMILKGSKILQN